MSIFDRCCYKSILNYLAGQYLTVDGLSLHPRNFYMSNTIVTVDLAGPQFAVIIYLGAL